LHPRGQGQTASISRQATFDESSTPSLTGDPTDEEWEAHDEWLAGSCVHGGYLLSLFLGNITRVKNLRGFLRGLQGKPGPDSQFCWRKFSTMAPTKVFGFAQNDSDFVLDWLATFHP
jgi:hypothetical protein